MSPDKVQKMVPPKPLSLSVITMVSRVVESVSSGTDTKYISCTRSPK